MFALSDNPQNSSGNGQAPSDRLKKLLALEEAHTAKRIQIGRSRQEEDAEIEKARKKEDEERDVSRESEDEQRKEKRKEEDIRLEQYERELDDREEELRREEKNLKRCQLFDDQEELYSIPAQHPVPGLSSSEDIPNSHEPAKMTFRCGFCSRSFDKRFHRNEHEKIKHNVKTDPKHLCTEIGCGKRLSSKGCLNTHLNSVHQKGKWFSCERCGKVFYRPHHLTQYETVHPPMATPNELQTS